MTNQALENACKEIQETFRPERKQREKVILNAKRVKVMVEDGGYEFNTACKMLNLTYPLLEQAFMWLLDDNARLNSEFDTLIHGQQPSDYMMLGWFEEMFTFNTTRAA